jgi:hypothetical protein
LPGAASPLRFLLEIRDPDAAANHPKRFSRIHVNR